MSAIIRAHINRFYLQVAVDFNIMKLPSDTSDKSMKMQRLLVRISWFIVLMWLLRAHSILLQNRSSLGIQVIRARDLIDCDKTLDQYWSRETVTFKLDFMCTYLQFNFLITSLCVMRYGCCHRILRKGAHRIPMSKYQSSHLQPLGRKCSTSLVGWSISQELSIPFGMFLFKHLVSTFCGFTQSWVWLL